MSTSHAVVKCATGNLVVRSNEERDFAPGLPSRPKAPQWHAYLGPARMLQPELEQIDGFVDNIRRRSLTRDGSILSLSSWRNEKALVRWRTNTRHHQAQEKARLEILADYHLHVGHVTRDTHVPAGQVIQKHDARARPPLRTGYSAVREYSIASAPRAVPLGRLGLPDEIASAVVFPASDDASYITGAELFVNGDFAQL